MSLLERFKLNKKNLTLIVLAGIIFYCYEFFLRILTGAYQNEIIDYFAIHTHLGFSFLISSYNLTYFLMQIPAGLLLDKYGSKKCLTLATITCGLGNILFVANSYQFALIGRLIIGLGSSFAFIGILKLAKEFLPAKYFGLFTSVVISIGTLAAAFSQQISVWLGHYAISWINVFWVAGLLAFPLSIYLWMAIPKAKNLTKLLPSVSIAAKVVSTVIKNKAIWLNALWAGVIYIPTVVLTSQYGVYFFTKTYHLSKYQSTELITALLLGWVVFSPIAVLLANIVKKSAPLIIIFIILISLMLIIFSFASKVFTNYLIIYVFAFGLFSSIQVLVWQFFNMTCADKFLAVGLAVTNMIITGVTEIGQLSSGIILDLSSNINYFFTASISINDSQIMMASFTIFLLLAGFIFSIFNRSILRKNTNSY